MSERSYTERDASLAVECPHCDAEPGGPCWDQIGKDSVAVHYQRKERLRELIHEALALGGDTDREEPQ